jgi:hypothetical protein
LLPVLEFKKLKFMKYSIDEIIAAAEQELEAWKCEGEKKRTDFDYEKLGFVRAVAKRLSDSSQNSGKPLVSGSLPLSKYEVRTADNGDECIMLKDFNVRIATFGKGTKQDAIAINKLLGGNDR